MVVNIVGSYEIADLRLEGIKNYLYSPENNITFNVYRLITPTKFKPELEGTDRFVKRVTKNMEPQNEVDFERFFKLCDDARQILHLPPDQLLILLTEEHNENNYFGYVDRNMKNVFIQTSNWKEILGEDIDDDLPVIYEIVVWTLRFLLFKHRGEMLSLLPPETRGCVMDMCIQKKDIHFKMRTGDISEKVMDLISQRKINQVYFQQIITILEKIRSGLLFRERSKIGNIPSRIKLKYINDKIQLVLVDYGDLIVSMERKWLMFYILVLSHPEGISASQIEKYRNELISIYYDLWIDKSDSSVEKNVDSFIKNSKSEIKSRINSELKSKIPSNVLNEYELKYNPKKRIFSVNLDRSLYFDRGELK
jgi:hypothetical protein